MRALFCTNCYEEYVTTDPDMAPWILPCGHTHCLKCLKRLTIGGQISCPRNDCQERHTENERAKNFTFFDVVQQMEHKFSALHVEKQCSQCGSLVDPCSLSFCSKCHDESNQEGNQPNLKCDKCPPCELHSQKMQEFIPQTERETFKNMCDTVEEINTNTLRHLNRVEQLYDATHELNDEFEDKRNVISEKYPITATPRAQSFTRSVDELVIPCLQDLDEKLKAACDAFQELLESFK